jgi:molybdopterin/thiamine biosynthesis adenylyltransferase
MEFYKWHEQEAHRNLYTVEMSTLERGLGGGFTLQALHTPSPATGQVTAYGNLAYGEDRAIGVKVVFPTKYPYAPPRVSPLDLAFDDAGNVVFEQVRMFGKGNQYGDGHMCLFREEMWDRNEHNVGWVLRRAQEWLGHADSPEGFPKHKIVEEIPAQMAHKGQVLLPYEFTPPANAKRGEMLLSQFKPNHYLLEHNLIASNPFSLSLGAEKFEWFTFEEGATLKTLLPGPAIGAQDIYSLFITHHNENLIEGPQKRNVAFYLPADPMPWHFFKLGIVPLPNGQVNIQTDYLISRNINKELYLRTRDVFDEVSLKGKKVTIIGLGAIGSEVARSLARNGVGHFNLFDFDTFELGNSVRHAADLFYIGERKVSVARQLIQRSNPNITVNEYHVDIFYDNSFLEQCLQNSDMCLVLTAEDSVDYFINDKLVGKYEMPFLFARVSAGGMSGAIQLVEKGKTACLRCLSSQDADRLPIPKGGITAGELSPEYGSCSSPALPGSEVDTKELALQVTRVALQRLLKGARPAYPKAMGHQFYWHGPAGSKGRAPFTWEIKKHSILTDCTVCHG